MRGRHKYTLCSIVFMFRKDALPWLCPFASISMNRKVSGSWESRMGEVAVRHTCTRAGLKLLLAAVQFGAGECLRGGSRCEAMNIIVRLIGNAGLSMSKQATWGTLHQFVSHIECERTRVVHAREHPQPRCSAAYECAAASVCMSGADTPHC